jgi:hypothetical protein
MHLVPLQRSPGCSVSPSDGHWLASPRTRRTCSLRVLAKSDGKHDAADSLSRGDRSGAFVKPGSGDRGPANDGGGRLGPAHVD